MVDLEVRNLRHIREIKNLRHIFYGLLIFTKDKQ